MNNIIKANNLKKTYNTAAENIMALKGINFTVQEGDFVTIMGHSGAGKTTLLNLIGCLDGISGGELIVLGNDLSAIKEKKLPKIRRNSIGMIFQEFFFIPTLTALENVELPTIFNKGKKNKEIRKRAIKLLEKVGLGHRLNHFPRELSGGEMQRVAIARSLINSPKIVLADEPTGNLDTKNAQGIFDLLRQINEEEGVTILAATHNVKLAHQANRIIHLEDGKINKIESTNELIRFKE